MANPYAPPQAAVSDVPAASAGPKGIGGWMILPVIGLFVFPLRVLWSLAAQYWPIFRDGIWANLTTPGSASYHVLWGPLLVYEIAFNIAFLLFDLALLVFLFRKSPRFPKLFVAFALLNVFFVVTDGIVGYQIPAVAASGMETIAGEIGRALALACIWAPYFLVSQRVKNTFVEKE